MADFGERAFSSHAYIIASQDATLRENEAKLLACRFLCDSTGERPCLTCPACKLVLAGRHPDLLIIARKIDEKGNKKRDLQVDQIRQMAADAFIRPSQAAKKVYLIEDAGLMNSAAQNAALKILEDPPHYAVFLLLTDSAEALLPTVRSRCALLRPQPDKATAPEPVEHELAEEYLTLLARGDEPGLCAFMGRNEAMDGEKLGGLIAAAKAHLAAFLCGRGRLEGVNRKEAFRLLALLDRADEYLRLNVGAKHVLGLLCVFER